MSSAPIRKYVKFFRSENKKFQPNDNKESPRKQKDSSIQFIWEELPNRRTLRNAGMVHLFGDFLDPSKYFKNPLKKEDKCLSYSP